MPNSALVSGVLPHPFPWTMHGGAPPRVLVLDHEPDAARALQGALIANGYAVEVGQDADAVLSSIERFMPAAVVCDAAFPGMAGMALVRQIQESHPDVRLVVTGSSDIRSAVEAVRAGAVDYLSKPVDLDLACDVIATAMNGRWLHSGVDGGGSIVSGLIPVGSSPVMQRLLATARNLAATDTCVLLTGETGTGKEVLARFIHFNGARKDRPLVAVNCAAIAPGLFEAELFGHQRGAFTGAVSSRRGSFELASGGTLFLDEVTEMPMDMQAKILRALEEQTIRRLGSEESIAVNSRIVSATNKEPEQEVRARRLREDLYWRLNVVRLQIPPLRERREDIIPLAWQFLHQLRQKLEKPIPDFSGEVLDVFATYDWPGNVRELRNAVECGVVFARAGEPIRLGHLPLHLRRRTPRSRQSAPGPLRSLREAELQHIRDVLDACAGNRARAAAILGVSPVTLWRKLGKAAPAP
jgi:DNA-binding NtrC family response regulator